MLFRSVGDKELVKAMRTLETKVARKVIRKLVRRSAKEFQKAVKAITPVLDPSVIHVGAGTQLPIPGTLKKKGYQIRSGNTRRGFVRVNLVASGRDKLGIGGDDKFFTPQIIESGSKRGIEGQHLLKRAWDKNHKSIDDKLQRDIASGIVSTWKELNR